MKKILVLITALMIGLSSAFAIDLIEGRKVELSELDFNTVVSYPYKITNKSDNDVSILMIKKEIKTDKMYRVSPSKNGNYYVVECSYDGGKTWHFTDSSPDLEEANKKMEYLKKGLTTSGLTHEEAKASIPEGAPTIGDSDQNSKTKSTKKEKTDEILEVYEYVIPANSTVNFVFTNECKRNKEFWGFGWVNNNSYISNGGADWWSRQGNIIINKDGYLTYLENNVRKNMCQIKKLSHNYLMD